MFVEVIEMKRKFFENNSQHSGSRVYSSHKKSVLTSILEMGYKFESPQKYIWAEPNMLGIIFFSTCVSRSDCLSSFAKRLSAERYVYSISFDSAHFGDSRIRFGKWDSTIFERNHRRTKKNYLILNHTILWLNFDLVFTIFSNQHYHNKSCKYFG